MLNILVKVEDGLKIKIWDHISLYLRGGCMPKVVLDFPLGTIYMVNQQLTHKVRLTQVYMFNIAELERTRTNTIPYGTEANAAEVEDGLQIKIWDQISLYLRGGCMPKVVLDFQLGTIYMVNRYVFGLNPY